MMNGRTFGVEIEISNKSMNEMATLLRAAGFMVYNDRDGSMNNGSRMFNIYEKYSMDRPEYKLAWKVVYDGSVSGGCEVVSPVLSGSAGLAQVKGVLKAMNKAGAKANDKCGLHVHVGAGDLSALELQHVARRYDAFESVIDTFVNPRRRDDCSDWCHTMRPIIKNIDEMAVVSTKSMIQRILGRYYKLNLKAYLKHGTVEFRQLEGTTSWTKVVNWIEFCVCFVEASRFSAGVVVAYLNETSEAFKEIPEEVREFSSYKEIDVYELSRIWDLDTRVAINKRVLEMNKVFPGLFTLKGPDVWNVNLSFKKVSFPQVTGTWNQGIPANVVAHLHHVASTHNQTC